MRRLDILGFDVGALIAMRHSPVRNYVIPGLTSWLVGQPGPKGCIRLFECERAQQEAIAPHSHRFDFHAVVLDGWVKNRIWSPVDDPLRDDGDRYAEKILRYGGAPGEYEEPRSAGISPWVYEDTTFRAGECYGMKADEVHSIFFGKGALVLFFEGPSVAETSLMLEPYVAGYGTVPTGAVQPWMFAKETVK